jgi:hypothetical protein
MTTSQDFKNALVVFEGLPPGLAVNAASVLAVTLGNRVDKLLGTDVTDADGVVHPGIIYSPLPILQADMAQIGRIVEAAAGDEDVFFAAFSSLAQSCKTYDEYVRRMSDTPTSRLDAIAVAVVGPKKRVNKLVGSLPLFR